MKITKVQRQVKRANQYSIFIDNKYSFSLPEAALVELKLRVGQEVSPDDLGMLDDQVQFNKAKNYCFSLLSYRARGTEEIRGYLLRKNYRPDIISRTIDYLTSKAFLDDEKFTEQWVENRLTTRHASIRQIKSELRQKKIRDDVISKIIDSYDVDEVKQIKDLVAKKRNQEKYKDDLKMMQYLSRRGFSYDKILIALRRRAE